MTGTSGRQRVSPRALSDFPIVKPPDWLTAHFGKIVAPLFKRSCSAVDESRKLADLRDVLLPKLISGELRVEAAETEMVASL